LHSASGHEHHGFHIHVCPGETVQLGNLVKHEEGFEEQGAPAAQQRTEPNCLVEWCDGRKTFLLAWRTLLGRGLRWNLLEAVGLGSKCWENHYSALAPTSDFSEEAHMG